MDLDSAAQGAAPVATNTGDEQGGETKERHIRLPNFKRGLSGGFAHKCSVLDCHTMGPTVDYIQLHEKLCHNRLHEVAAHLKEAQEDDNGKEFDFESMVEEKNQKKKESKLLRRHELELRDSTDVRIPDCLWAVGNIRMNEKDATKHGYRKSSMFQDMSPQEQELVLRFKPKIDGEEIVGRSLYSVNHGEKCDLSTCENHVDNQDDFLCLNIKDVCVILFYYDIEVLSWYRKVGDDCWCAEYRHVPGVSSFGLALSMRSLHMHGDSVADGRRDII